ncbi:MAG: cysteine desulfurase family protein, partial [Candidatus Pacearchaeota archaeon]|nr:cysteine desulfurase family protein [Candidatus Pacearchaeota archaeon]
MRKRIYLDYAAATPVDSRVLSAMRPYFQKHFGNPSSLHAEGQKAAAALEDSRRKLALFLGCSPQEIIFTSGATEANNLAIAGSVKGKKEAHIVVSAIEHESVLEPCRQMQEEGLAQITYVKPDKEGRIDPGDVEKSIKRNTCLVSIGYANSEIGTVQDMAAIGEVCSRKGVPFHSDAVQAAPYLPCQPGKLKVDLMTLSSHKIYGVKGAGLLFCRKGVEIRPSLFGGGQEGGVRSGTENVPAIVGFARAAELIADPKVSIQTIPMRHMRDRILKEVPCRIPGAHVTGSMSHRLPNSASFWFEGVNGKTLAIALDLRGFCVSAGSACSERSS